MNRLKIINITFCLTVISTGLKAQILADFEVPPTTLELNDTTSIIGGSFKTQIPADFQIPPFQKPLITLQLNDKTPIVAENEEEILNAGKFNTNRLQKRNQINTLDNMPLIYPNSVHKNIPEFSYDDRTYTIQVAP